MTLIDDLGIVNRIELARQRYCQVTGKLPTRLVLTPNDLAELNYWHEENPNDRAYLKVEHSNEAEVLGMRFRVEPFATALRVYFQES